MAILDHLVPAFGRTPGPQPGEFDLDPNIRPRSPDLGGSLILGSLELFTFLASAATLVYITKRASARRSSGE
jgi:hypothetical protein